MQASCRNGAKFASSRPRTSRFASCRRLAEQYAQLDRRSARNQAKRGSTSVSQAGGRRPRAPDRAHGRPLLEEQGRGRLVDPKGELEEGDEALAVARREFEEELGSPLPPVELVELGEITQAGGKRIIAFAGEADFDVADVHSNTFTIEWPPHSGRQQEFPEIDRAAWVSCDDARVKLIKGQVELIDRLLDLLRANGPDAGGERSSSPTLF